MIGHDAIAHLAIAAVPGGAINYAYKMVAEPASFAFGTYDLGAELTHTTVVVVPPRIRKSPPKLSGVRRSAAVLYNARIRK